MSSFVFGGRACQDPRPLYRQCLEQGLPTANWWGKANRFLVPRGPEWGAGTLLLARDDLDRLDLGAEFDLKVDDFTRSVTLKRVSVIAPPACVTPGLRGDKQAVYAVEVADRRYRLAKVPVDKAYNVGSGGEYLDATTNAGTPWTWQTLVQDLATTLGVGTLTLPYAPAGTPEDFRFYAAFAWAALNAVLDACSLAVVYDPALDAFSVAEVGAADPPNAAALTANDSFRLWDKDATAANAGRLPAKAKVRFLWAAQPADGSSPFYVIQKSPPGSAPAAFLPAGTVAWLDGGMEATGDSGGTPDNDTDLQARATEVAAKFYQALLTGSDPLVRRYHGVRDDAGLRPGNRVQGVAWLDVGAGMVTEVYRGPVPRTPAPDPLVAPGSNVKVVRVFAGVVGDADGNPFVTVGSDCSDVGATYYLATMTEYDSVGSCLNDLCGSFAGSPPAPLAETCRLVWLAALYQTAFAGVPGNGSYLTTGLPYIALKWDNKTLTAAIDLRDGGGDPPTNVQTLTLPVYVTGSLPLFLRCDGTSPTAGVGVPTL